MLLVAHVLGTSFITLKKINLKLTMAQKNNKTRFLEDKKTSTWRLKDEKIVKCSRSQGQR